MKSYPTKFKSFQRKIVQMGALQKLQNSIQTLLACLPNPYKLCILGDIWKTTMPFSSSKYLLFVVDSQI